MARHDDDTQQLGLCSLSPEVTVHILSFVANAHDLCSLSMTCRALATASRDDALWKPLGHPSWADHIIREGGGWKGAYMLWLRAAVLQFRKLAPYLKSQGSKKFRVNVVLQGDPGTGKKRLTRRYHHERRSNHPLLASLSERYNVDVWIQLCGPPRFQLSCANVVVLVYDIADRSSFDNISVWLGQIRKQAPEGTRMVLVGNKVDLASTRRAVTYLEGSQKAEELGTLFCECSAKTGEGVANVFHHFVWVLTSWQYVEHMATPAHVPSEDLLAQLFLHTGTTTKTNTPAGCALQ